MSKFIYRECSLTEEQIKHRCRFLKIPYVKGEYQENYKWRAWAAFKFWHKREMDKRDLLKRCYKNA